MIFPVIVLISFSVLAGPVVAETYDIVGYKDHSSYQESLPYGALLFNRDADTVGKNRRFNRFIRVNSDGLKNFPQQDGYCFYLNHYKEQNDGVRRSYTVRSVKHINGEEPIVEVETGFFTPAGWLGSKKGPDYCVEGLRKVGKVELYFSSKAGRAFSWDISFVRAPY